MRIPFVHCGSNVGWMANGTSRYCAAANTGSLSGWPSGRPSCVNGATYAPRAPSSTARSSSFAAARELERAVGEGARGGYVAPFHHSGVPLGHPDNDPVFAAAQDLDVPLAIHPTFEPQWTKGTRMGTWENVKQLRLLASVSASDGVRQQFTTLFDYGVFDKFPRLKILVLESGAGWIGYWLDRVDAVYGHTFIGNRVPLEHKPSDYFRERIWISADPDERMIPALAERYGVERFLWASDFPHADHTPEYIHDLNDLVDMFPEHQRRAFIGDNARALFKLNT